MKVDRLHLRRSFAFCRVWGSEERHDLHIHDCLEIGVVLENNLEYRFGDKTYRGKPGDVFLCRPFEPHWSYAEPGKPFESILVLFTPSAVRSVPDGSRLLVPFYTDRGVSPLIRADTPYAKAIRQAACRAADAQERNTDAWTTRQYMQLIEILLQVNDYARTANELSPELAPRSAIADSVGYILERYREPLDGEELVRQAGMGRTVFFDEFRTLTGLSPHDFVNRLRVQHAMDLLRSSKLPMIELFEQCGFQSLSSFNKQFKSYTGISPRDYRKKEGASNINFGTASDADAFRNQPGS